MQAASRLDGIPPYIFAQLDAAVAAARDRGIDVIDLSKSDPDLPAPAVVRERLKDAADQDASHAYPPFRGTRALREAIARFYRERFDVVVDPETEVYVLSGSKEGIAHLPLALLNPGDPALIPDPGYPTYRAGCLLAGADPVSLPLHAHHDFLPDFGSVPQDVLQRARLLVLNYPNNPTGAIAPRAFVAEAVRLAEQYDLAIIYDSAYSEITFDGYRAPSLLQFEGARRRGLEVMTFSKSFNMQGYRLGALVGSARLIEMFATVETNVMAGVYTPIQCAGVAALEIAWREGYSRRMATVYQERQHILLESLHAEGIDVPAPRATVYLWAPVPSGETSRRFAARLLEETGVALSPGDGFGPAGEGYVRISLTADAAQCREAARRWHGLWQPRNAPRHVLSPVH